ncbi:MAG: zinc-binding dehydrogenase, partial [Chloroflexaceae bacterium]|nr:zinc-binding dehydrogenase [Chloroflexaceae bacterium]
IVVKDSIRDRMNRKEYLDSNRQDGKDMMVALTCHDTQALVETARREGHKAVVQTAAASALGRMVLALGNHFNLPVIHVVRRPEQVELLRSEGASYVLNSSEPGFEKQLRQLCKELNATIGFDAVAGEMTGQLLHAMPNGGRVIVYGALSLAGCLVHPSDLIFQQKRVEGFWLADWFRTQTPLTSLRTALALQRLFGSTLKTSVRACFPLEETATALKLYARSMTEGKVLLMPGLRRGRM